MELEKPCPIKVLPGAKLKINQRRQDDDDNGINCVLLVFHPIGNRAHAASAVTPSQLKLNELKGVVNAEGLTTLDQRGSVAPEELLEAGDEAVCACAEATEDFAPTCRAVPEVAFAFFAAAKACAFSARSCAIFFWLYS